MLKRLFTYAHVQKHTDRHLSHVRRKNDQILHANITIWISNSQHTESTRNILSVRDRFIVIAVCEWVGFCCCCCCRCCCFAVSFLLSSVTIH